jgi:hypothetical protein
VDTADLKNALAEFAVFARQLKGDEKGEAQTFLDHFFRALGHAGVIEAGATFEHRIAKKPGSSQLELIHEAGPSRLGGKKFADLLWPQRVLIEMKKRGENLEKHYDQLFEYWSHIVPNRPPYAILCNFDEFWIYDFNIQLFDPVERVPLAKLVESVSAFNFLLPTAKTPIFEDNRVEVTRKAADRMAHLFREIVGRGEDRERAQRFILQLLVAMVAEDIDLLPRDLLTELLRDCAENGANSYDLLGGLFRQMASPVPARAGRYEGVGYFNGGLFAVVDPIDLKRPESYALHDAARHNDWSKVKPEIFGTLFQESMDKSERHAFGAHFTSEFDIQKVVGPTIVRPWRERIEAAGKRANDLRRVLADLRRFRVLDPACGSGNFLFVAYREMKRLERDILLRLQEVSAREPLESAISLHQFYGIDNQPFAVELAKVTLMLAKELELIEAKKLADSAQLLIEEKPLPLDNLDKNIVCADALFIEWPQADAIIGNPPYLGAKLLKPEHGADYVKKLRRAYPEIPGMADYCVYWFRKAHDTLKESTAANPCSGRAGLVGTQNIRNNKSRTGGLDYIAKTGTIVEAIDNQPWSGEANVHVSIVDWAKTQDPALLPETRLLWTKAAPAPKLPSPDSKRSKKAALKHADLVIRAIPFINSALSDEVDVSAAQILRSSTQPQRVYNGQFPRHQGFVLTPAEAAELLRENPANREVVHPYLIGREMLTHEQPQRWIIDFQKMDVFEARRFAAPFRWIEERVLPHVAEMAKREQESTGKTTGQDQQWLKTWWQHFRCRKELIDQLRSLPRYIACCEVTKRPIFCFLDPDIRPDHTLEAFVFADDYSFGILQSSLHWTWFTMKCSKLKSDFRYTPASVFDTFPWPQSPTRDHIAAVAEAAVALRALRRETMSKLNYSLRDLYRTLDQPGTNPLREAQNRLDAATRSAYGFAPEADALTALLALNVELAGKEKRGEPVQAPGMPEGLGESITMSVDSIRADAPSAAPTAVSRLL